EKFRSVFAKDYFQKTSQMPRENPITGLDLHLGWRKQASGKWFLGLSVENGRIKDDGGYRLRSGLRAIVSQFRPIVRITAQQDILLADIAAEHKAGIDNLLAQHGIATPDDL